MTIRRGVPSVSLTLVLALALANVAVPTQVARAAHAAYYPEAPGAPRQLATADTVPDARQSTFVVLLGSDTLAVERYRRDGDTISGELTGRREGVVQEWSIQLGGDGYARAAGSVVRRAGAPDGTPPLQGMSLAFGDSGVVVTVSGTGRFQAVPPRTLPFVNLSAGVVEQVVRQGAMMGDSATVPLLPFGAPGVIQALVRRGASGDVTANVAGVEIRARVDSDGRLLGAEVPAQGVRFVRADGDEAALSANPPPPDYSAPPGAPYTARGVTIRNDIAHLSLAGTLTLPDAASARNPVPAVVFATGSGPQDRDSSTPALPGWAPFRQLADALGRRGIAVLRMDDRGVGGSEAGPPGATTRDLAEDVRAALDYLRTVPEVDPRRLMLLGHSEGALVVAMAAAQDPSVSAVALLAAPGWTGRTVSDSQVMEVMREQGVPEGVRDSLLARNAIARDSVAAGNPWMAFWLDYDPLPTMRRITAPVLVVQGATDRQVTADQGAVVARAIREGGNRDVSLRVIPEVNHLFVRDPSGAFSGYTGLPTLELEPSVAETVVDWLAARSSPGDAPG